MNDLRQMTMDVLANWGLDGTHIYFGNSLNEYVWSVILFLIALLVFRVVQFMLLERLKRFAEKTTTDLDDTVVKVVRSFTPPFWLFLSFWVALRPLEVSPFASKLITGILIIWAVYQVVIAAGIFIEDVLFKRFAHDKDPTTQAALKILVRLAKGALWGLGIILMLSNLGVDVTSLLAGVGIGGIAIAFALQGILSDLFASFSIFFDRPFKVGDFIIVGDTLGTVEHIGIMTTRIRSLYGEEIVMPNEELVSATVKNYHDMQERRITFTFGIEYDTPHEKVAKIPSMVQKIIEHADTTRFDRAHFLKYGDSSLDFEVVYYVLDGDYNLYMDKQQEINLALLKTFEKEKIVFAFPTRTVHMVTGANS